jgi:hypothetical protein
MRALTTGQKIALGFGTLILLTSVLGGVAVFSMKRVQIQAQTLAQGYVPESEIAGELQAAFAKSVLEIWCYALTAEAGYLTDGRQALAEVHPELGKLRDHLKDLEPALARFESLVDQTEARNRDLLRQRDKLDQAATGFIANLDNLIVRKLISRILEVGVGRRLAVIHPHSAASGGGPGQLRRRGARRWSGNADVNLKLEIKNYAKME